MRGGGARQLRSVPKMAGGPGFEPGLSGSEPLVLPLNHPPKVRIAPYPAAPHAFWKLGSHPEGVKEGRWRNAAV